MIMAYHLQDFQTRVLSRVNAELQRCLPQGTGPAQRLFDAMHYSAMGGKRVRPLLVYAAAEAVGDITNDIDRIASAVELIHAYSLIHDDLPAMDNDDLRRGMPTCHIAYDEATAILAGDALQTLAFQQLARLEQVSANTALDMISDLSHAAGAEGMVAGQAIDLAAVNQALDLAALERMHQLKTGAMIRVSVKLGALAAGANYEQLAALTRYSQNIGLAFQVTDDILDVESPTDQLGKNQGSDQARNKPTYTSLLGLEEAKSKAKALSQASFDALEEFDERADPLRAIAEYIVARRF